MHDGVGVGPEVAFGLVRTIPPKTTSPAVLTATEYAVLGLLSGGEQSGYDLKKRADSSVGYFWTPAKSRIYAILPRLVEAGLVRKRDVRQQGRPDKQLYRLTQEGRRALVEWLAHGPLEPDPERHLLLLKLFFGDLAGPEAMIEQVRERRLEVERFRAELEQIDERPPRTERDDLFPRLTRMYGLAWADAIIAWAKAAEKELARAAADEA
jgi:DNA-binding PadR family transcriptional regulator